MSDWEDVPTKVTNNNIRDFAGLENGYVGGVDREDPNANLKSINEALSDPKLHPVAKQALLEAKAKINAGWEDVPQVGTPSGAGPNKPPANNAGWEDVPKADTQTPAFKSGSAFKDTKDLIPSLDDIKNGWKSFTQDLGKPVKQWKDMSAKERQDFVDAGQKMMTDEKSAGSGILDAVGALPAMVAGGAAGIYHGIKDWDASSGLKSANEVMGKLLPSSLMGNENHQNSEGYKTAMAPFTAVMDTLNAVPQGYGEILNAMGADKAAAQVTDAGKLGIMVGAGALGVHEGMKQFSAKSTENLNDLRAKLQDIQKEATVDQPQFTNGASDRGIAPTEEAPQGQLFSQEQDTPTNPIGEEGQGDLFNGMPPKLPDPTIAHADDFGVVNPYNVGGHVDAAMEGRPTTIDNPQGELFGGEHLNDPTPNVRTSSFPEETLPTATFQRDGTPGTRDVKRAKEAELAAEQQARDAEQSQIASDKSAAFDAADKAKDVDYSKMEAQKELDFMNKVNDIEGGSAPARRAFLDRSNLDFQHLQDVVGDKSLMSREHTSAMADALGKGDVASALSTIAGNHPSPMYRSLATFLASRMDGIKVNVHPDSIMRHGDRDVTGLYDPQSGNITLSGLGATSPHTFLHEAVHSLTSQLMQLRPDDIRVKGMENLFKSMQALGMNKEFPGIVNSREFVAEAFSNPKVQEFLKQQRVDSRSMWSKFVDTVKRMFGMKTGIETQLGNALDHTLDLGKQLMNASDTKTRADMMSVFKEAGMNNKLADLMADKPKDTQPSEVKNNGDVEQVTSKIAGLNKIKDQFDFTPKPPEEIMAMAKTAPDIKAGTLETIKANLDAGGMMASLRHNNNPIIKGTFAYVDQAVKNYEKLVRDNITNKQNGVKPLLQKLSDDDFTLVHSQMMLDEGQRVLTSQELAAKGWHTDMINAYNRIRETSAAILKMENEARSRLNPPLPPIPERIGHLAGRFVGDFSHMVWKTNEDGLREPVIRVNGNTKWGAQKIADHIQAEHPEWTVDKQEYNPIRQATNGDRFQGFREMMNYLGRNNEDVAKALDSLDRFNRKAASNFLDAQRHAKDKKEQAGGIIGSEGNKAWLDAKTNAEQGFKAQLMYMDTAYKWTEMQNAMENISKFTADPEVIKQQPNALKWSTAYTDHALGRNQGFMAEFASNLLSEVGRVTGLGHTTMKRAVNTMSAFEMRNWMGIGNVPFALKHLVLPLQKMPAMLTYLKTVGNMEGSVIASGARALESYYKYLKNDPNLTAFQKQAFEYAKTNNVFNVDLSDVSGKINSGKLARTIGKFSDLDFSVPEHAIRGTSFFTYAHLLESSGMPAQSALSAAEHLSKFLYTDYASHEAPRAVAKGGFIGQLALQITRYKMNEVSQLGFFNRERIPMNDSDHTALQKVMSNAPLMTHIASMLAFTGVTGMIAFKEADEAYSLWQKYVRGNPDNLTALLQRSKAPDYVKYGLFSKLGIDAKISEAELLPAPFPTTTAEISQLGLAFNAARYHDMFHTKQLALGMAPSTLRGPLENNMFTQPKDPNTGKSLYLNPNTGEGRYARTDAEKNLRTIGFHSVDERNELDGNWANKRIMKDHADLADHVMEKAKGLLASGVKPQDVATQLAPQYAQHQQEGQPDFATALTSYMEKRQEDQKTQMQLKAANTDKMGNSLKILFNK